MGAGPLELETGFYNSPFCSRYLLHNGEAQFLQFPICVTTAAEYAVAPIIVRYFGGSSQDELWRQQSAVSGINHHINL